MTNRLTLKKIRQMKSGQTVFRVWGYTTDYKSVVEIAVNAFTFCGKKIGPVFNKKLLKKEHVTGDFYYKVDDLKQIGVGASWRTKCTSYRTAEGVAAFTSRKAAEKFAEELRQGRHPKEMAEIIKYHQQMAKGAHLKKIQNDLPIKSIFSFGGQTFHRPELVLPTRSNLKPMPEIIASLSKLENLSALEKVTPRVSGEHPHPEKLESITNTIPPSFHEGDKDEAKNDPVDHRS